MKKIIIAVFLLASFVAGAQDTPYVKPVTPTNMSSSYYFKQQLKVDSVFQARKAIFRDSVGFLGVTTVPTALDADSNRKAANTAWVRKWISENVTPGTPSIAASGWGTTGNYAAPFPLGYNLGTKDSFGLPIWTNGQLRLFIPADGITSKGATGANKMLIIDTVNKTLSYADVPTGGGGGSGDGIVSLGTGYGLINVNDSTYRVDTAALATQYDLSGRTAVADTASMLSPYLRSATAAATYATITNLNLKASQSALVDTAAAIRADFPAGGTGGNDSAHVAMQTAVDSSYILFLKSNRAIAPDTLRAFGGIDTTNKWVQTIYSSNDTIYKVKNGVATVVAVVSGGSGSNWLNGVYNANNIYRSGGQVGIGDTSRSRLTITYNSLGANPGGSGANNTSDTTSLMLINNTAAAAGAQQASPAITWVGYGWKTTATAASQAVKWRAYVLPVQGTGAPSSSWNLEPSTNNHTAYVPSTFSLSSSGALTMSGSITANGGFASNGNIGGNAFTAQAASTFNLNSLAATPTNGISMINGIAATSGVPVQYSGNLRFSGTAWNGSASGQSDFRFGNRPIAGASLTAKIVYQHGVSNASYVDIHALHSNGRVEMYNTLTLKSYTVATLPTGNTGDMAYVTDATAPTYLGALTGGGSVVCPVFFNGTAWVSH